MLDLGRREQGALMPDLERWQWSVILDLGQGAVVGSEVLQWIWHQRLVVHLGDGLDQLRIIDELKDGRVAWCVEGQAAF